VHVYVCMSVCCVLRVLCAVFLLLFLSCEQPLTPKLCSHTLQCVEGNPSVPTLENCPRPTFGFMCRKPVVAPSQRRSTGILRGRVIMWPFISRRCRGAVRAVLRLLGTVSSAVGRDIIAEITQSKQQVVWWTESIHNRVREYWAHPPEECPRTL
jgi:hypothetical protein